MLKDEGNLRNKIRREGETWIENIDKSREFSEDKFIEILSLGPSRDDIIKEKYIKKDIILETLKIGDIFPAYFCINNLFLDIDFITESPSEIIKMKISDIQELLPVINKQFLLNKNFLGII